MISFIIRRLISALVVLLILTLIIFCVVRVLPGDPVDLYISRAEVTQLSPEQVDLIRHEFGLDKPVYIQYLDWLGNVVKGDLGKSYFLQEKVTTVIGERLPITMYLGIISILISCILGVTFGVICAVRRGKRIDDFLSVLANIGLTSPTFWVGIILIYLLSLKLHWLPAFGYTSPLDNFGLSTKQLVMPVFCLSITAVAVLTRQTRSSMLEVLRLDYMRTAYSKGLSERTVVIKHSLKNAFIPIITTIGMQVRNMFGGVVLIETVFNIPGMGRLMIDGVLGQDFMIVQGGILIIGMCILLVNLIVDISYGWFDPRIRYN